MKSEMTVILKGMPRALWQAAKAKGDRQIPRQSLKATVIRLLQGWVKDEPVAPTKKPTAKKPPAPSVELF